MDDLPKTQIALVVGRVGPKSKEGLIRAMLEIIAWEPRSWFCLGLFRFQAEPPGG